MLLAVLAELIKFDLSCYKFFILAGPVIDALAALAREFYKLFL